MSAARLKLREDVYWTSTPTGVAVLTHTGLVPIGGASVGRWLERLAPFLDGRHSLASLTAALPADRRAFVESLVSGLLEHGVVREISDDEPHGLSVEEVDAYRAEIGFVGYFRDSARRAFGRWRDLAVVVLGAGPLLPAVTQAAVRSGVRLVRVVETPDAATDTVRSDAGAGAMATRDREQRCEWRAADPRTPGDVAAALAGADLILQVSGTADPTLATLVERHCEEASIPVAQALLAGGEAWLCPAGQPGADWAGWCDGWRRRGALLGGQRRASANGTVAAPRDGLDHDGLDHDGLGTDTAAVVVAGQVVQDAFGYVTGIRPLPDRPRMTRIRLDTLDSETHGFLAPALSRPSSAEPAATFLRRVAELDAAPAIAASDFDREAVAFVDTQLGVFGEISEGNLTQLPMHVTQTMVSDPVGLLGPRARPVVTGAGTDFSSARYRAALNALAVYGSLMVDPRRLLTADGQGLLTAGQPPHSALAALCRGEMDGWVHAVDLADGQARLLPAELVFPALRGPAEPYAAPCGAAAAYGWRDAVRDGLVQHCRRLTIAEALAADRAFPLVEPEAAPLDGTGQRYLAMLKAVGEPFAVHDVTGMLGVPTFACQLSDDPVVYGCGLSVTAALRDVLEQTLLGYQARVHREPQYAPAPAGDLPARSRSSTTRAVATARPLEVRDLVLGLARRGHAAAAVPLDHDPEVHQRMPNAVQVVVTDAGG